MTLESKTQKELDAERAKAKQDAAIKKRAERPIKGGAVSFDSPEMQKRDEQIHREDVDSQGNPVSEGKNQEGKQDEDFDLLDDWLLGKYEFPRATDAEIEQERIKREQERIE